MVVIHTGTMNGADLDRADIRELECDPRLERHSIEVSVAKAIDIAVSTGTVPSKAERLAVERVALHTAGVSKVENDLVVDRGATS